MKKITLFFSFMGIIALESCTVNNPEPAPTVVNNAPKNEVFEITTSFNAANNYSKIVPFKSPLFSSDIVLVYHLYDVVNGNDVWRQMPQTYYISNGGAIDYNFDFTKNDVNIFVGANFSLSNLSATWTQNQTFRIVIIPGYFTNKNAKNIVLKDYAAVIKAFNINDNNVIKIKD